LPVNVSFRNSKNCLN